MPRLAANLTMMFNEWPFLDRFGAAADAGFDAVEFLFPYDFAPAQIAERLQRHRLTPALFNLPPGDWQAGERGMAAIPGRAEEFRASVAMALRYAEATGTKCLHVMGGIAGRSDPGNQAAYRNALAFACETAAKQGITVVIEPLNTRDVPGYFLNDFSFAAELIGTLGLPNLKLQYDIYHRQILHGDVLKSLEATLPIIGHVQIAAVPARGEPTTGELDDVRVLRHLDRLGYAGFVGCEYRPANGTLAGLAWRDRLSAG